MLMRRVRQFAAPSTRPPEHEVDEPLATALLLAELARADNKMEASESETIETLLAERFELEPAEVQALMDKAATHDEAAISLYDYVKSLNQRLDYPGRCQMIEMLWQVAWADGHLDSDEEYRLRKIAGLLYVADEDFIRAKLKVMNQAPA